MDAGLTRSNIISGFKTAGIWPMDELFFDDTDFMPSEVTDQPAPASDVDPGGRTSAMASRDESRQPEEEALSQEASGLPWDLTISTNSSDEDINLEKSLESIRPYPKAATARPLVVEENDVRRLF